MKNILIAIDRDGTLTFDKKLHIGHTNDWKKKIKILPKVKEGIKLLRKKTPNAKLYLVSNQSGVAIKNFPLLTQKRADEVCEHVTKKLKLDGFISCGKVNQNYIKRRPQYKFINSLVGNYSCIKPKTGMINQALKELNWGKRETLIYVIGDRYIDVKTGLNAGGFGVLIPFENEPGELEKFERYVKGNKNVFVAKDFLDACKWITSLL